jgi:Cu-Zn family superoxide dismutase
LIKNVLLNNRLLKTETDYGICTKKNKINKVMNFKEISDTRCPRTRAIECQCSQVKAITEAKSSVTALCELEQSDSVKGTILLRQFEAGQGTVIVGRITGLEPGEHGFHIHEFGDLTDGCESAGGHYNPDDVDHGDIDNGHVGDLGNVTADTDGIADFTLIAKRVDLIGERSVVGRAIVIHSDEDDLGKGGDAESLKTGNAGDRLACGVITLTDK